MDNVTHTAVQYNAPSSKPMTVDEARKVMWLRPNHRPLGELIDEGYLTQKDLEWAVANAYVPALRQAAQILLDQQKKVEAKATNLVRATAPAAGVPNLPFPLKLNLEQARSTEWPFQPYKGRLMGELVDTGQLSLKDLGYAVERAHEERVRQAAVALMLVRLNQVVTEPAPSAGLLRVVSSGRSFSERRQYFFALVEGFVAGALMASLIAVLIASIVSAFKTDSIKSFLAVLFTPAGVVAALIVLAVGWGLSKGTTWLLDRSMKGLDKQIETHRKGHEGEERVVAAMHSALDGTWHLFRNVVLPGRQRSDIDSVLVGPPGVWALEIKTFTGEYRNIGEHWEQRAGNRWMLSKQSPSRQAQVNAARLASFLKADGIQQWVTPAVIWANPESQLTVENPGTAVWRLDRLPDELGNIWQEERVAEPVRAKIVEKLTRLCQAQQEATKLA